MPKKMKANTFPKIIYNDWVDLANRSLKNRSLESLHTETYEGITLRPLYTKASLEESLGKKHAILLSSIREQKQETTWTIAQRSYATLANEYIRETKQLLAIGNEAVVYDGSQRVEWTDEALYNLAQLIRTYPVYAWDVANDDRFVEVFTILSEAEREHVTGVVDSASVLLDKYGQVRTSLVNVVPAHIAGADAVCELALSLAYAEEAATKYASLSEFLQQVAVRFAVDTHFFIELAKLRAFRVLWKMFCSAYDEQEHERIPVLVETSLRSYTKMDPYVNMLRGGNEAFAAVLGGADVLTVHPHSVLTEVDDAALRYAKNIQLVIREETFVDKVVDPAGGSYFIDTLTNELVERAWELFLTIIDSGGVREYEASGALAERLEATHSKRLESLFTRKDALIGTNVYADPKEEIVADSSFDVDGRLAHSYEQLRFLFQENKPNISLLSFGELKDAKPLFDFVSGFIAPCSLVVREEKLFQTVAEMIDWMDEVSDDYYIICLPSAIEQSFKDEICDHLPQEKWIDVAQLSFSSEEKDQWKEAGACGFYHKGKDQLRKLRDIYRRWKRVRGGDDEA